MISRDKCIGCHDDFYNQQGGFDGKGCWSRKTGRMATRYRTGVWTMPLEPGAFREVRVPSCYRQNGVVFTDRPHSEAVDVVRLRRGAQ